ncbi:hypothetical protein PILCRDRAFT_826111 [Piloderma croceum F 1598]|uniref:Uncharacterized protein n=1 Tax=Piloderma croceum (strain F 1598) TaxID=765440 RepID=A0A0C3AS18_PILCF|nr:hypothetical protein PILCRDRAFT_826111 [Piloderma croceum F 1598]
MSRCTERKTATISRYAQPKPSLEPTLSPPFEISKILDPETSMSRTHDLLSDVTPNHWLVLRSTQ